MRCRSRSMASGKWLLQSQHDPRGPIPRVTRLRPEHPDHGGSPTIRTDTRLLDPAFVEGRHFPAPSADSSSSCAKESRSPIPNSRAGPVNRRGLAFECPWRNQGEAPFRTNGGVAGRRRVDSRRHWESSSVDPILWIMKDRPEKTDEPIEPCWKAIARWETEGGASRDRPHRQRVSAEPVERNTGSPLERVCAE
jgi:hypothetical protein